MPERRFDPRGIVSAWTLFTSVFVWTPTMRMLLKPEVSQWKVGSFQGIGRSGLWWLFPLAALLILLFFYLEGRGRFRPLVHALLLAWHLPLTAAIVYWAISGGTDAHFEGAGWGARIPLVVVAIPFTAGSILAVAWVVLERSGSLHVPVWPWSDIGRGRILVALALFPLAIAFYRWGEGFDWRTRVAIATSILQWILLAGGLQSHPASRPESLTDRDARWPDRSVRRGSCRGP